MIKADLDSNGVISKISSSKFNLGLVAAKELGPDEQELANVLHKLQRLVEA
jgi:hypothetical protein